ncbi:hypothetical protein [Magnetospirillum aberrantis]|uniref:Uncharacterized protein n=1 Tax=Magnetospirillum aberrantis SpK TaxID=908842 RepID=A0A7C9V0N7_9PROT|nr:hypothetical protein [Magnetospirillum aberrantis]NFV81291.1 hypothetical protein [Magnetospirillum aberrantis SpK]
MSEYLRAHKISGNPPHIHDTLDALSPAIEGGLYLDGIAHTLHKVIYILLDRAKEKPHPYPAPGFTDAAAWLNRAVDVVCALPAGEDHDAIEAAILDVLEGFRALAYGERLPRRLASRLVRHEARLHDVADDWCGEQAGAPADGWVEWLDQRAATTHAADITAWFDGRPGERLGAYSGVPAGVVALLPEAIRPARAA